MLYLQLQVGLKQNGSRVWHGWTFFPESDNSGLFEAEGKAPQSQALSDSGRRVQHDQTLKLFGWVQQWLTLTKMPDPCR